MIGDISLFYALLKYFMHSFDVKMWNFFWTYSCWKAMDQYYLRVQRRSPWKVRQNSLIDISRKMNDYRYLSLQLLERFNQPEEKLEIKEIEIYGWGTTCQSDAD